MSLLFLPTISLEESWEYRHVASATFVGALGNPGPHVCVESALPAESSPQVPRTVNIDQALADFLLLAHGEAAV